MKLTLSWLVLVWTRDVSSNQSYFAAQTFTSGSAAQPGPPKPGYTQPAAPFLFFQDLQHTRTRICYKTLAKSDLRPWSLDLSEIPPGTTTATALVAPGLTVQSSPQVYLLLATHRTAVFTRWDMMNTQGSTSPKPFLCF